MGQLDPLGEVGGAPYHYDGVPISPLPFPSRRVEPALHRARYPDRVLSPREVKDPDRDPDPVFYAIYPAYPNLTYKLRARAVAEAYADVRHGPTFERGGSFRYARPPVRPAPAHLWWGRLHGRLRGPGPWRWEWPDYFAPNRYIRGLYVRGSYQLQHRAPPGGAVITHADGDAEEAPLFQRQQWTPPTRVRAYVHQARPESERGWLQFGHYPEIRRPWVASPRLRTEPPGPYTGGMPPLPAQWPIPRPDAVATLDPAWHRGTWPANTAGLDLFHCHLDLVGIAARRLHPVRANGAFAYLRYSYYSDLMYAPARAIPPRPRSVGVLEPLARGVVPCLRPKARMHADGLIEVKPSRGGPLVNDLPMFQRGGELAQPPLVAHAYDLTAALWARVVRVWEVVQGPHAEAPHYHLREVGRSLILPLKALAKSAGRGSALPPWPFPAPLGGAQALVQVAPQGGWDSALHPLFLGISVALALAAGVLYLVRQASPLELSLWPQPRPTCPCPAVTLFVCWPLVIEAGPLNWVLGAYLARFPCVLLNPQAPRIAAAVGWALALAAATRAELPHPWGKAGLCAHVPAWGTGAPYGDPLGGLPSSTWPEHYPVDARPRRVGVERAKGGDWTGWGGLAYDAGHNLGLLR